MFVHDGDQVLAEYENGSFKRNYVYGTYIDEPLAVVTPTSTRYYHQNRTYSVMALSNSSGQLAERYGYTAYGKRRVVSPTGVTLANSAMGNQIGFTGRYHDGETGLTYFRARYQNGDLGRFVSRDPASLGDFPTGRPRMESAGWRLLALGVRHQYGYGIANVAGILDPMGLYAEVVVQGNQVTITIPIDYAGAGANAATISNFSNAIEQGWSGQFGQYQVTTHVVSGSQNQVEITAGDGRAVVYNGTHGVWPEARPPETIVHETGHLLGLPDTYGTSSSDDIMNRLGSPPTALDIAQILKGNAQVTPICR